MSDNPADSRAPFAHLPPFHANTPAPTGTEAEVCSDIARRQAHGVAKYGKTVAGNPLPPPAWLQHLYEELTDAAIYAKRLLPLLTRLHELELYAAHLDGPALERYNATLKEVETLRARVSELENYVEQLKGAVLYRAEQACRSESRAGRLADANAAMREQLVLCFTFFGEEINRLTLNETAECGIQRLSRDTAAVLDKYQDAAALADAPGANELPDHYDSDQVADAAARTAARAQEGGRE